MAPLNADREHPTEESVLSLEDGWLFLRHKGLHENRPVILFLHGLGESGLCFEEALHTPALTGYSLVVPDMIGYGRSSRASGGDYSMETQVRRIWRLVDHLEVRSFFLVGHSLGGDLASLMSAGDTARRIRGLVNIEGDLTPHDVFFSNKVVAVAEQGDFRRWFEEDFKEEIVLKGWGERWASCRRYYASLRFCRPEAFLDNAREIFQRNQPLAGRPESLSGMTYAGLRVPKVFCWGSESLARGTLEFLESASLAHRGFEPAFHWPMIDRPQEFYDFLLSFLTGSAG